ncbi:MAG TPA: hypothetical protein VIH99_09985 [Bdellovibrionota bacterium]|jgi:hypothetical protein
MPALFTLLVFATAAQAGPNPAACRNLEESVQLLASQRTEPELRSSVGTCLIRYRIEQPEAARAGLRILRNGSEDILLKEDLIEAFVDSNLRRKVKIEGQLAPKLGRQDQAAVDHTIAGANDLLAAAQAVRSMEETIPTTHLEADYFRALSEIVLDDSNHVLLRAAAVTALERLTVKVVISGIYDEKSVRLARETLHTVAAREDAASYYTNAAVAYNRLADDGFPGFVRDSGTSRMISSVKPGK